MKTFKDHCGAFYESMAHLYKIKQAELDFYHFKPGQTIASIGAQCCHIEAAYAATIDFNYKFKNAVWKIFASE